MTTLEVAFVNEFDEPVTGYAEFDGSMIYETDTSGAIKISEHLARSAQYCTISPVDGHWSVKFFGPIAQRVLRCPCIDANAKLWWRSITGLDVTSQRSNLRAGVVDIGYPSGLKPAWRAIRQADPLYGAAEHPINYHGYNVCCIIDTCNVFESAQIFFADASNHIDRDRVSLSGVISSIVDLVDLHNVNFINLSFGFYFDANKEEDLRTRELLLDAIEYAQDMGCVIFAAAGNDRRTLPAFPASHESVVGVGALGMRKLAPKFTLSRNKEYKSLDEEEAQGVTPYGIEVFHDTETCCGEGLDVLAPGVSVFLEHGRGTVIELFGTSFAAPIALTVIGRLVSCDENFETVPLAERYRYVKDRLKEWCSDLGMSRHRQGFGLLSTLAAGIGSMARK